MLRWLLPTLAAAAALGASCAANVPRHAGPAFAPMEDGRFVTVDGLDKTLFDVIEWQLKREPAAPWVQRETASVSPPPGVDGQALEVTFVNHATVLVQMAGLNILTDPVWSERVGPLSWAGPRRFAPPGVAFAALPRIHLVLVSHNHYDHMDLATLSRLAREHDPEFLVPLANCHYLRRTGTERCRELDWWQAHRATDRVTVTAVPAQHWSRRGALDRNRGLWAGFAIEGPRRIYFAGDTGFGPHFQEIAERIGPPDLAMLPIGAYLPRWFMAPQHISPAEAVAAHEILGASQTMAIHFGSFRLADDGQDQPVFDLDAARAGAGLAASDFWVPANGDLRRWP